MGVKFIGPVHIKRDRVVIGVNYSQGFSIRSDTIEVPIADLADTQVVEAINDYVHTCLMEAWAARQPPQEHLPLEKWE